MSRVRTPRTLTPPYEMSTIKVEKLHKLFVYGNLKRGFPLNYILEDSRFLGEAKTDPWYKLFNLGNFPALQSNYKITWSKQHEGYSVHGELYEVNDEILAQLDWVEGEGKLYKRDTVCIDVPPDLSNVQAYFWIGQLTRKQECGPEWPPKENP